MNWVDPQGLFVWVIPWAIVEVAGWAGLGAGIGWSLWDTSSNNPTWNFPTTDTSGGEVCYAASGKKGDSFRGGKKKDRDQWGKYGNDKDFKNWWHRKGKDQRGGGDIEPEDIKDIYDEWVEEGRPTAK